MQVEIDPRDDHWRQMMPAAFLLGLLLIALGAMVWALAERRTASMEEARRHTIVKAELVGDWVSGSFTL